jgi:hypothetical protein
VALLEHLAEGLNNGLGIVPLLNVHDLFFAHWMTSFNLWLNASHNQ